MTVNLTLLDDFLMAQICHIPWFILWQDLFALPSDGHPTKKQYCLKAGLKKFSEHGDKADMKERMQLNTMN
jgi:hypothetical protein